MVALPDPDVPETELTAKMREGLELAAESFDVPRPEPPSSSSAEALQEWADSGLQAWLARKSRAVITVFGPPVDYADLKAEKPRPALYKKTADRFMIEVGKLRAREKELRAQVNSGEISDDDPRWLEFDALHLLSTRLMMTNTVAALALLFWEARDRD